MHMKFAVKFLSLALLVTSVQVDAAQKQQTNSLGLTKNQSVLALGAGLLAIGGSIKLWKNRRAAAHEVVMGDEGLLTGKGSAEPVSDADSKDKDAKRRAAAEEVNADRLRHLEQCFHLVATNLKNPAVFAAVAPTVERALAIMEADHGVDDADLDREVESSPELRIARQQIRADKLKGRLGDREKTYTAVTTLRARFLAQGKKDQRKKQ